MHIQMDLSNKKARIIIFQVSGLYTITVKKGPEVKLFLWFEVFGRESEESMTLKENLIRKMRIDQLSLKIKKSIGMPMDEKKVDKEAVIELVQMASGTHRKIRDLDIFHFESIKDKDKFLILDNELKLYLGKTDDAVMRKSPTIKEMISIGNIRKILNDNDIVLTTKEATIDNISGMLLKEIDLSINEADLDELVLDGNEALKNKDTKGIHESLNFFSELLSYKDASRFFSSKSKRVLGQLSDSKSGKKSLKPVIVYNETDHRLSLFLKRIGSEEKDVINVLWESEEENEIRLDGELVFLELKQLCLAKG